MEPGDRASWACGPSDTPGSFPAAHHQNDGTVYASCGIQGYPGYSPASASLSEQARNSFGAYADMELHASGGGTVSGALRFVVNGPTSGNVHLRTAQFETVVDEKRSLTAAKSVVAAKLQNSRRVVGRWARDEKGADVADQLASRSTQIAARISRLAEARSANSVRGIEGDAARIYFRAMRLALASSELEFSGRTRRPPRDPINALLGFCYGMLVTECIGAAQSVGLDYQMGCFHRPRAGRPSLALDLAEELRAISDRFVVSLVRRRQIGPEDFDRSPGGAVYLSDHGRTRLLPAWEKHKESEVQHQLLRRPVERWALPSVQATLLARHFRGDLPAYPPFVLP